MSTLASTGTLQSTGARIGIVDYGMGNRRSAEKAFEHLGVEVLLSAERDELERADALVLPGVGAFPQAMRNLRERELDGWLRERFEAGVPLLGICLGMQLAFENSTEHGGADGLGIVPGLVRELRAGELKLPHIGWNRVYRQREDPFMAGIAQGRPFYHVHSFIAEPRDEADVLATAEYGERFATIVTRGSFVGVQFHPEKSSTDGLALLGNFVARALVAN